MIFPRLSLSLFAVLLCAIWSPTGEGASYYIAATGNDASAGTIDNPWRTVAPLNAKGAFAAGDQIYFRGGDTFKGPLSIRMTGTASARCIIGSYGTGKATMIGNELSGTGSFPTGYDDCIVKLTNSEYVTVQNLAMFANVGTNYGTFSFVPGNRLTGIRITSTRFSGARFRSVTVDRCSFIGTFFGVWFNYGWGYMTGEPAGNCDGFDGVSVTGNYFNTYQSGCNLTGYNRFNNATPGQSINLTVSDNIFEKIYGDPHIGSEGEGLSISCASGVTVERNLLRYIAGTGAYYSSAIGGSDAMAMVSVSNFRIRGNEVFGTRNCLGANDGCAIDADQNCNDGEICYNLTYENAGPGIQFGSFGGTFTRNIAVHHNISCNDVRGNTVNSTNGAIWLFGTDQCQIYNNSIFINKDRTIGVPCGVRYCPGFSNTNIKVFNNIIKTTAGVEMVSGLIDTGTSHFANLYDPSGSALSGAHGTYTLADAGWSSLSTFSPPLGGFLPSQQVSVVTNFDLIAASAARGRAIDPSPHITMTMLSASTADWHGLVPPIVDLGAVKYSATSTPTNASAFVSQNLPTSMTVGQSSMVSVSMKNTGTTTWSAASLYRLGSQNPYDNMTWGTNRVLLAAGESVTPGQTKTFSFTVTAPSSAGTYNFQWRMVQDGVEWFGPTSSNVVVTVGSAVGDSTAPTVTVTQPANGSTISNTVLLAASASDNVGVTAVDWLVDGALLGSATIPPYNLAWDTTAAGNGSHSIFARARDAAGNTGVSATSAVTVSNVISDALASLKQGGFEKPRIANGRYEYTPVRSLWTFAGTAGISRNDSGVTSGNPNAPEGAQVAFLQGNGSCSQSLDFTAGMFSLSLSAAQRGNSQASWQTFRVLIDGTVVGTFKPSGTAYERMNTSAFTVTAGSHAVTLEGLNPNGGDNTALIDLVVISASAAPPSGSG
jgi:parallel beta-helix repeat protein